MKQDESTATLIDYLKAAPLYLLPQHLLSRAMLALTRIRFAPFKNMHIRWFAKQFNIDMNEAKQPELTAYPTFNHFFTRELREDAREIITGNNRFACPVDGAISQAETINNGRIYQAKGHDYTLKALVGGDPQLAETFNNGRFATIYLSPKDYHRIHMPCDATLTQMLHVPGRLFSVNTASAKVIPGLFARNERVVALFETEHGPMAMILVGAIFVGSIETVWHGVVTPPSRHNVKQWHYEGEQRVSLTKGEEMGRFNMGSTVIMLFANPEIELADNIQAGETVRLGELLAEHPQQSQQN
ncbi:MAG: archaetidylserine decarboxylase [Gammaproteobacteria bacterium]|nr:archaetidylserine decarboxylase [Gammaproteobacteria bacterium]MCF6229521.1 archaetidylserine decarboxylase [Gammaproteobacteria bacterium]